MVRIRGTSRPHALTRPFGLLGEPSRFVMQTRQFQNPRTRIAARAA